MAIWHSTPIDVSTMPSDTLNEITGVRPGYVGLCLHLVRQYVHLPYMSQLECLVKFLE